MMSCDQKENKYDLQIKFWKAYFNYYFILYIFIMAMLSIYIFVYYLYFEIFASFIREQRKLFI